MLRRVLVKAHCLRRARRGASAEPPPRAALLQASAALCELGRSVLRLTGLARRANDKAGALTLLERKRLEMARALATDPALLLLDEIAGGLTERECQSLLDAVRAVHATGVTIVWIEHVVHALLSVAQRLVVVDFGVKIADGPPAEVLASKDVQSVYMGAEEHV
jgi:branched-chain amino acid transport system ATP-binding protein